MEVEKKYRVKKEGGDGCVVSSQEQSICGSWPWLEKKGRKGLVILWMNQVGLTEANLLMITGTDSLTYQWPLPKITSNISRGLRWPYPYSYFRGKGRQKQHQDASQSCGSFPGHLPAHFRRHHS